MTLKRGYYFLMGGAAVFIIGIVLTVVYALPIARQIQAETSMLQDTVIEPGRSATVSLYVANITKPLSVVVSSDNSDVRLNAVLIDPAGNTGLDSTFTENLATGAEPTVAGYYNLTITNIDDSPTSINAVFGHIPGVGRESVNVDIFSGVIAGVGVIIAGIMVMIVGVVIVVVDRKKR